MPKIQMRSTFTIILIAIVFMLNKPAYGDDPKRPFTIGTKQDIRSILPLFQQLGEYHQLRRMIMPPILTLQPDGRVTCHLCKEAPELDIVKNEKTSENELHVNLVLKKKLEWGDGENITREDIKFTLETMALAPYPSGTKPLLPIKYILFDKEEDNKLSLVLRHRRSDALQLFTISLLPRHKAKDIRKLQEKPEDLHAFLTALQDRAYHYGPYKIAKALPDSLMLVKNSKNEWEGSPTEDIQLKFYENAKLLESALRSSEIDQTLSREFTWSQFTELTAESPNFSSLVDIEGISSNTQEVILLNLRSPFLVNPNLRQALFHAIDRSRISQIYYKGFALPSEGVINPGIMQRLNEKRTPPYDTKLATFLLEQAGWQKKPDGFRYADSQQKLSLTLTCTQERLQTPWHLQVQEDFRKLGIELKIDLVPEAEYLRQTLGHRRFKDLACMRWTLPPLSVPLSLFHSLAIPSSENDYSGQNYSGWDQPIVNRILENAIKESDVILALRLFVRLEKQFESEIPAIPIVYSPELTLVRKVGPNSATKDMQKSLASFSDQLRKKL